MAQKSKAKTLLRRLREVSQQAKCRLFLQEAGLTPDTSPPGSIAMGDPGTPSEEQSLGPAGVPPKEKSPRKIILRINIKKEEKLGWWLKGLSTCFTHESLGLGPQHPGQ